MTDTNLSETRVKGRAQEGGHYVDPITISDNFYGNLEKLQKYYSMFDSVTILDTSDIQHKGLASITMGTINESISKDELPPWFINNLPEITSRIT